MPLRLVVILITCAGALQLSAVTPAFAEFPQTMKIHAKVLDGRVDVVVEAFIDAPPRAVWSVFTDYDHMTDFVTSLERSAIVDREKEVLVVSQRGKNRFGPFSSTFESTREVQLTPYSLMRSRGLDGNVRDYEATTRFAPESSGTRIFHQVHFAPAIWVPPVIGPTLIEHETRVHFEELFQEIERRQVKERLHSSTKSSATGAEE